MRALCSRPVIKRSGAVHVGRQGSAVGALQGPSPAGSRGSSSPGLQVRGRPGVPHVVGADAPQLAHDEALLLGPVLLGMGEPGRGVEAWPDDLSHDL